MKEKKNVSVLAIVGLVISALALIISLVIPVIFSTGAFILAAIGAVLAIIGIIRSKKKLIGILALVISLGTCGLVFAAQDSLQHDLDNMSGDNTQEVLEKYVDVKLGKLKISKDEYGLVTSQMKVTITNKAEEKKSYSITIEAVNKKGNRIMDDTIMVNDLGPGQSTENKVFEYIESDKVKSMKSATFKISEVSMY